LSSYRDLLAWQRAIDLVENVYSATESWPKSELFGLTSQVRRAAVSVPADIAEGQERFSTKEFIHHLSIARGSLLEVETHIIVTQRLRYLSTEVTSALLECSAEVSRLISGLSRSLSTNN
jgi:four helix bundle protein